MTIWKQRIIAIASILVAAGLVVWSSPEARPGYEFPRMVAWTMLVLSAVLALMAFKPGKVVIPADIESVPMRIIWPMLVILAGMAYLAPRLGFLSTSFLVFVATALVFSPDRLGVRRIALVVAIAACFTVSLYLLFVLLLGVQLPRALLF
ncbi:hypothetical protein B1C78_09955 [Thioalkalivibrio denitrificans]|uniref:DUF1468 domain-containing protein n=1 Tax=Thioalkalivibrio denitrificans TaxID=108003 RepID=A0A1V3NGE0_9GAMM|nr:tripartite tricarboxylate transporter TctB family protein [Thioalkalivibrio denitrificans]OOG23846.1 hypothetical protein B1C78_09955 [Thioalkalivibrio denitrificans]